MDIFASLESAAHDAAQVIEHPFHTIGARLTAIRASLATFFGHPYCPPPLADALDSLHGVVSDLAQEVAELRVPCPCKPAPTASTTTVADDAGQALPAAAPPAPEPEKVTLAGADLADFKAWQAAKAGAASFAASQG
jgi:hypothetical protein